MFTNVSESRPCSDCLTTHQLGWVGGCLSPYSLSEKSVQPDGRQAVSLELAVGLQVKLQGLNTKAISQGRWSV